MAVDWTEIYKNYRGLWVALESDEKTVVASGKTAREAWERAREQGCAQPILSRMPKELVTYIGIDADEVQL